MIEFKIGYDNTAEIDLDGTAEDIAAEAIAFVRIVYDTILEQDKKSANRFRKMFIGALYRNKDAIFKRVGFGGDDDFVSKTSIISGGREDGNP